MVKAMVITGAEKVQSSKLGKSAITLNPLFRKRDCSDTVPDEYPLPYPNRILYFYYPYLDRNFSGFRVVTK